VKCPKCGFVSFAGLEKCKKCGYVFAKPTPETSPSLPAGPPSEAPAISKPPPLPAVPPVNPVRKQPDPPQAPTVVAISTQPEPPPQPIPVEETPTVRATAAQLDLAAAETATPGESPQPWREELSDRVEKFRRRRARLQPEGESARNLELDFSEPDVYPKQDFDQDFLDGALTASEAADAGDEVELGEPAIAFPSETPMGQTIVMGAPEAEVGRLETAPAEAEELSWGEPPPKAEPMEILVTPPTITSPEPEEVGGIHIAPLGRRFLAGVTDAFVLLLGAAIFGVIFWRFCGRISMSPLNAAVLGIVAALEIFAYFWLFTALASATPGLLWVGCEIRSLGGARPSVQESFWRAVGVLVSLSALMLGFVWACVDSDSMTWHDRMSSTVITEVHQTAEFARQSVEA
jgi:uncharacterized RDD family membrane protein YckC